MMKDKKGVLGLDTAKNFILVLLLIAVIGYVAIISLSILNTSTDDILPSTSKGIYNESTVGVVNETGVQLASPKLGKYRNSECTLNICINSSEFVIPSTNYTESSECFVSFSGANGTQAANNSVWNCSYDISYIEADAYETLTNVTTGTAGFFYNTSTWFALISIVIIILIISLVIVAVSRFGGSGRMAGSEMDEGL